MKNKDPKQETALAKRLYNDATERPAKPSPNSTDTPETIRRKKLMVLLWAKMSQMFGGIWESSYDGVRGPAIKTWFDALGIFTEEEILGAIDLCLDWKKDKGLIPTLPDFRALCFASRKPPNFTERREAEEKIAGKPASMIEHLSRFASSHIAQREVARMRGIIAGAPAETKQESYDNLGLARRWGPL